VPRGDVPALAERITYLLRHPEIGAQLGQAGQQLVLERFDFGVLASRLEDFYQQIVDRPYAVGAGSSRR
jgi:colanic acid/amylovoran biosynthesis glycosyltransferase